MALPKVHSLLSCFWMKTHHNSTKAYPWIGDGIQNVSRRFIPLSAVTTRNYSVVGQSRCSSDWIYSQPSPP